MPDSLASLSGADQPLVRVRPPGPASRAWWGRGQRFAAPMGRRPDSVGEPPPSARPAATIVYAEGRGSNVLDVDGNRYVDLAAGFGALLVGHSHPTIQRAVARQSQRLMQALGDVYPADVRLQLMERLSQLHVAPGARVMLGQSGADAVTAALKTAMLHTGKPGVVAFSGAYHGLSYGPLAACGLRASYREPFAAQLNAAVRFVEYPLAAERTEPSLLAVRRELAAGDVGAVLVEPILGRGGCVVPPPGFLPRLLHLAHERGALFIADEIWTGLGRAGRMLWSAQEGVVADLVCLGKGLGGGLPISACVGTEDVMMDWQRDDEVVHTSTFAGAPLACAAALATLDLLQRQGLVERSATLGEHWRQCLQERLGELPEIEVGGAGLMIGIARWGCPGWAATIARALLERGYLVSTGGGAREVVILTPALTIAEEQLDGFVQQLQNLLRGPLPSHP